MFMRAARATPAKHSPLIFCRKRPLLDSQTTAASIAVTTPNPVPQMNLLAEFGRLVDEGGGGESNFDPWLERFGLLVEQGATSC
jgi:hypothetical protein